MLAELRRGNASYMEMAIAQGDLRALEVIYKLYKEGFREKYPRFGFWKPMQVAAAHNRLEILEWLSQQEESSEWLGDVWLLHYALLGCDIRVVDWVYSNFRGEKGSLMPSPALNTVAARGNEEVLRRTLLEANPNITWCDSTLMDSAAANGHLHIVKYLHETRSEGCTTAAMDKAAANGHLDVVAFLHANRQEGCTIRAMNDAAANGHLDIVKFLHEHRQEGCTEKAMDNAAAGGHLHVIKFLHENRTEGCTEVALMSAFKHGHVDTLVYLHDKYGCIGECLGGMNMDLSRKHLSVMKYACEHHRDDLTADSLVQVTDDSLLEMVRLFELYDVDGWSPNVMDHAARLGDLACVRYLDKHRGEGCTEKAMDMAASRGHLCVVAYLHEHRVEGCTKRALDGAAGVGSMDVIRFLRGNRSEGCTSKAIENAALNGHVEVIDFLLDNYDVVVSPASVLAAAKVGNVKVLARLIRLCPPDSIRDVFIELASSGHLSCMKYVMNLMEVGQNAINSALVEAVINGHELVVALLAPRVKKSKWISNAIEGAARMGDIDMVRLLSLTRHRVRPQSALGFVIAAASGCIELLDLLDHCCNGQDGPNHGRDEVAAIRINYKGYFMQVRAAQVAAASSDGHAEAMWWLLQRYHHHCDPQVEEEVVESGSLVLMSILYQHLRFPDAYEAMVAAVSQGHINILKHLCMSFPHAVVSDCYHLDRAAACGSLDVVKFVLANIKEDSNSRMAIDNAAARGHLDIVRFLHENCSKGCTDDALTLASQNNHLTVLNYLLVNKVYQESPRNVAAEQHRSAQMSSFAAKYPHLARTALRRSKSIELAWQNGNRRILELLQRYGEKGNSPELHPARAIRAGRLDMLRYLQMHQARNYSNQVMDLAVAKGDLRIVKFLHVSGNKSGPKAPCSTRAMDMAAENGHLAIVQYLHQHRAEGCTKRAMDSAIHNRDLGMVKFLHENRSEGYSEAELEASLARDLDDEGMVHRFFGITDDRTRHEYLMKTKFERLICTGRSAHQ